MDAQGVAVTGDGEWANPRWNYPEYPPGSVVELRVHGVGGEPPSGMTRDPHPRNVGGDSLAGFWRARNPVVTHLDEPRLHVREVLAWGGQTSGTIRHAFWVLLLPFALFNVAGRMHPADARSGRARWHRATARVLAYSMTLGVVALTGALAFDLLGVQYEVPSDTEAVEGPTGAWLLAPLRFFRNPAARMGFLALLPAAALIVLWMAGRYRTRDLEGYSEDGTVAADEPVCLDDTDFWRNEWTASRLRATHATGGFALIGATLALVLGDVGPAHQETAWWAAFAVASTVVVGCGIVTALPATVRPGRSEPLHHLQWLLRLSALAVLVSAVTVALGTHIPNPWPPLRWLSALAGVLAVVWWIGAELQVATGKRPDTKVTRNLLLAAGIAAVVVAFPGASEDLAANAGTTELGLLPPSFAWLPHGIREAMATLGPGLYVPAYALLLPLTSLQAVLLLVLLATGVETARTPRPGADPGTSGFPLNVGGAVTAVLALLLITAVGASLHALTIDWLGERKAPKAPDGLVLPWWYGLTAQVAAFALPLSLGAAFLGRNRARRKIGSLLVRNPTAEEVAADLERGLGGPVGSPPFGDRAKARLGQVGKEWLMQRLLRDGGHILTAGVVATVVAVGGYLAFVAVDERHLSDELPLTSAAMWIVTGLAVGAIGLIRSSFRDREKRRQVGALWDVLSFWPRVTHPFAPPCYGEAVVPMLAQRVQRLSEKGYEIVLAGHSQGSIVSLAAVVQSPAKRVHLVSYGSPVAILYERFFPGVFGEPDGTIVRGEQRVHTWHYLFAMTEPFAMPFWKVQGATEAERRSGWEANMKIPHADAPCPVCGWWKGGPPHPAPNSAQLQTDFVVSDPDKWKPALDPAEPAPKTHSTYHDNREVDEHLARIAAVAAGPP